MPLWEEASCPSGKDETSTWATCLWGSSLGGISLFLFYPSKQRCPGLIQPPLRHTLPAQQFYHPAGVVTREQQGQTIAVCTSSHRRGAPIREEGCSASSLPVLQMRSL